MRRISPTTLSWLGQLKAKKKVFLMTSSNADYAKFILKSIFVDEAGKEIDYWKYFDIDARPHLNSTLHHSEGEYSKIVHTTKGNVYFDYRNNGDDNGEV